MKHIVKQPYFKWTPGADNRLRYLAADGITMQKIAQLIGCTLDAVKSRLSDQGIRINTSKRPKQTPPPRPAHLIMWPPERLDVLRQMYLVERLTKKEIAQRMGLNTSQIETATAQYAMRRSCQWTPEKIAELIEMVRSQAYTREQIAEKLGCTPAAATRQMVTQGIGMSHISDEERAARRAKISHGCAAAKAVKPERVALMMRRIERIAYLTRRIENMRRCA